MRIPNAFSMAERILTLIFVPTAWNIYIAGVLPKLLAGFGISTISIAAVIYFGVPEGIWGKPWSYWCWVLIAWIIAGGLISLKFSSYAQVRQTSRLKN